MGTSGSGGPSISRRQRCLSAPALNTSLPHLEVNAHHFDDHQVGERAIVVSCGARVAVENTISVWD